MNLMHEGGPLKPIENYLPELKVIFQKRGVILAYLYGSQATGAAGPLSDVDVAVLFGRTVPEDKRFDHFLVLHGDLADVFKRDDVSVVDLAKGAPLLNNEIRLHGKVLYCQDDETRVEFEIRTLQRFMDTEPLRRELNERLTERIRRGLFGKPIPIHPVEASK
ncbi:MAG: nucleotidyltransferase domain-containing protein [Acidobacteria bacterium]|nr:nucleotidyltransferase domain-containing protein [Acidobacteriota bacterium]